jgi:Domain of unknown function (DUF4190)
MKRCPSCNQTFDEDWLSFCTNDGTSLIEDSSAANAPLPTMVWNPPAVPDLNSPAYDPVAPAPQFASGYNQPEWKPPPPPLYAQQQRNGLAVASMIVGLASLACFGVLPGIVALVLGFAALSKIKKDPDVGGNSQAWTGIITGGLGVLIHGIVGILYIILVVIGASSR